MDKKWLIERQGKQFVLYEGLLDEAHQQGLCRISTTLLQIPSPENGNLAICHAEVETSKGTFSGIGDASPTNVGRPIVPHIVRMAETRSKARAMRDAINIGVTAVEELDDDDSEAHRDSGALVPKDEPTPRFQASDSYTSEFPKASPYKPASANQIATMVKLSRLLGRPEDPSEDMTSAEVSERITELSREYNERKGGTAARRSV